jgi:phosphoribosylformimino-5-aminoimidazole carboxamide ribotide isomerase
MEIIPAVDIRGGRCVRLIQGDFKRETVFSQDPVEMAKHWASKGAHRIHVVDLDGAKTGMAQNKDIIAEIVKALDIPVQLGGGVRSIEAAQEMIDLGIDRVIIGTSAILNKDLAASIFERFGDRAILGIDAKDGMVAIHGWQETTERKAIEVAQEMEALGVRRIIHTDISTDGMLKGVNISAMERMARAVNIPVIASGGVTSLNDISNLRKLEPIGIEGAIIGKVLYTHLFELEQAIKIATE